MRRARESGAVLLVALLLVAMVASVAAQSLWKQWRSVEVEAAERARVQSSWLLTGALDWARVILREDARSGALDYLGEPWAVPLQEARLAAFLGADASLDTGAQAGAEQPFLSGHIVDLQSRLNLSSLAALGQISQPALRSFTRLFDVLGLPQSDLLRLAENLRLASDIGPDSDATGPLPPQRLEHLAAMGLTWEAIAALEPYVAVLPAKTPLNLNTASAQVIYSAVDGISMADARQLVSARADSPFRSVAEATRQLPGAQGLAAGDFSVASRYFEVNSRLRLGQAVVTERAVVQRDGLDVVVLQRARGTTFSSMSRDAAKAWRPSFSQRSSRTLGRSGLHA